MNTVLSCSISGIMNCVLNLKRSPTEIFDLLQGLNGFIHGYVSVCASCHNIQAWAALIIGFVGSILYELSRRSLKRSDIDDPMDSISTHGVCGLWSLIALGLFDD